MQEKIGRYLENFADKVETDTLTVKEAAVPFLLGGGLVIVLRTLFEGFQYIMMYG